MRIFMVGEELPLNVPYKDSEGKVMTPEDVLNLIWTAKKRGFLHITVFDNTTPNVLFIDKIVKIIP